MSQSAVIDRLDRELQQQGVKVNRLGSSPAIYHTVNGGLTLETGWTSISTKPPTIIAFENGMAIFTGGLVAPGDASATCIIQSLPESIVPKVQNFTIAIVSSDSNAGTDVGDRWFGVQTGGGVVTSSAVATSTANIEFTGVWFYKGF